MNEQKSILLINVRHGESEGNVAGTKMAELEKPNHEFALTPLGNLQAEAAAKFIFERFGKADTVYASTFLRSHQTAEHISPDILIDERLDERWDGVLHSLPKQLISAHYPQETMLRKKYGWYHHRAAGGESGSDVEMRIRSVVRDTYERYAPDKKIVFSAHGNWMLLFERLSKNLRIDAINRMKREDEIPNGCVSAYKVLSPFIFTPIFERYVPNESLRSKSNAYA